MEKRPYWLKKRIPVTEDSPDVFRLLKEPGLHTVCESASCPNIHECFNRRHVTFMILGNICTRNCRFCGVSQGKPELPDWQEPERIARAIKRLSMPYAVLTSVTRDDLPDGGAGQFARTVQKIRQISPETRIELLVPDFQGKPDDLETVLAARPDVIGHNLETVPALYPAVRPSSDYAVSLGVLEHIKSRGFLSRSALMLGLGETEKEVLSVMSDLRGVNVDFLVLGQYLQPSPNQVPVQEYVRPETFARYKETGLSLGFKEVHAGPFFRSSYRPEESPATP